MTEKSLYFKLLNSVRKFHSYCDDKEFNEEMFKALCMHVDAKLEALEKVVYRQALALDKLEK